MNINILFDLFRLGFQPVEKIPSADESVEAMGIKNNALSCRIENGNKITNITICEYNGVFSESEGTFYYVVLEKTCNAPDNLNYYHKIVEEFIAENQLINYVLDKFETKVV